MSSSCSSRPSDYWFKSPAELLQSYADATFKGNKLARDESIDFLDGEIRFKTYLVAVANLSSDVQALERAMNTKTANTCHSEEKSSQLCAIENALIQELHSRLDTLTFLQVSSIYTNQNIPNKDSYSDLIIQTRDTLFEIALILGDERIIRLLATELFDNAQNDDHKKALLLRLKSLYPESEIIAQKILESFSRNHFEYLNPLDLLEEFYGTNLTFEALLVSEVLENFESFLPRNYTDLDQALLLRFLGAKMGFEHIDEIYSRLISLDMSANAELECVLLDRIAVLKNDRSNSNADVIAENFRKEIDSFRIPDNWGLN